MPPTPPTEVREDVSYVVYHPVAGFLVDEDGAWSTDRDQARSYESRLHAGRGIRVATDNGMEWSVMSRCVVLEWITLIGSES